MRVCVCVCVCDWGLVCTVLFLVIELIHFCLDAIAFVI